MKKLMLILILYLLVLAASFANGRIEKSSTLNIYSVMSNEFTSKVFASFEKDSEIDVNIKYIEDDNLAFTLLDEKQNPTFDFIFGGSSLIYEELLSRDVFREYKTNSELIGTYFNRSSSSSEKWIPILLNPLVMVVNNKFIEEHNVNFPESWMDLLYPIYKQQIIIPNPVQTSCGADYLCTLAQIYGENGLERYQSKIDENVVLYPDSVLHAITAVEKGYSAITVCPLSYTYRFSQYDGDTNIVFPSEGTNYCRSGGAILKGAKNIENSEELVDWLKSGGVKKALDENYYTILSDDDVIDNVIYSKDTKINLISIDKNWMDANRQALIEKFDFANKKTTNVCSFTN
jgi:iron(III) transport system substrate-binding protein